MYSSEEFDSYYFKEHVKTFLTIFGKKKINFRDLSTNDKNLKNCCEKIAKDEKNLKDLDFVGIVKTYNQHYSNFTRNDIKEEFETFILEKKQKKENIKREKELRENEEQMRRAVENYNRAYGPIDKSSYKKSACWFFDKAISLQFGDVYVKMENRLLYATLN